jgi:hypothetical protein
VQGVVGVFREVDATLGAVEDLKRGQYGDITVFTPAPDHDIQAALEGGPSPVRLYTLIGGLCGATFGYWIAVWTSKYWPLVTGGKAFAAWIPFTIIGFELMVLIGGLSTVVGLFINARLPKLQMTVGYDPRFSEADFGIYVACGADRARAVEAALRRNGAVEVRNAA